MPTPGYIALQGQTPIEIDHTYRIEVTGFTFRKSTPITVHKSAGAVGVALGIPDVTGSFTAMLPATGLSFSPSALNDRPEGFTISFPYGGSKRLVTHCRFGEDSINVTPSSGDNALNFTFTGTAAIDA